MRRHCCFSLLLGLVVIAISCPALGYTSCLIEESTPELSTLARSIQALNGQFDTPARRLSPAAKLSVGEKTLLTERLRMVEQLIRSHPEEARSVLMDAGRVTALVAADASAAPLIEQSSGVSGEVVETVADDFVNHTSSSHFYLRTTTGDIEMFPTRDLKLHVYLHQRVQAQGVATRSVMSVEGVGLLVPSPEELGEAAGPVGADATAVSCSTTGVQNTAVLILNFPDTTLKYPTGMDSPSYWQQAVAGASPSSVSTFWTEASYGKTSASADVYGPLTLPQTYDCTTTSQMATAALTAAAGTVDFSKYTRVVLVYPAATCTFGGLGSIGCSNGNTNINHPVSIAWIPVTPSESTNTQFWGDLGHEMGHNLGLNHANTLDFGAMSLGPLDFQATNPGTVGGTGATTAAGAVTAVNTEYGDSFSAMGSPWSSAGPYSAEHRAKILGWIPPGDVQTVHYSSTYTVVPVESTSGLRALRVLRDPVSSSWLWVEFHQPTGNYESANLTVNKGNNMTTGAMIHYENGFGNPLYTYQLDMTPVATGNSFVDGGLTGAKTWSDPYSLLDITTNSTTSAGMNVTVTYDPPCATLAVSNGVIPAAGGMGTVTVTAPATCSWTASTNSTWLTLSGTTSGSGNGTVTYTAGANTAAAQLNTYITVQRQSLAVMQEGANVSLLGVSPANGAAALGVSTVFTVSLADAAGAADLRQLIYNMTGIGPACNVSVVLSNGAAYFYLARNDGSGQYTSSIAGGASGSISSPGCTLSGTGSGFSASGNNISVAMNLSFPATTATAYAIMASLFGTSGSASGVPLGTFIAGDPVPPLVVSPSSGRPGDTVAVTLEGSGTHFSSQSTIQIDGSDVTTSAFTPVNASMMSATLKVAPTATSLKHTVTVTTGSEVVTAPFTVVAYPTAIALTSSVAQAFPGGAVTLTAAVSSAGATPSGTVTFYDGDPSKTLGTGTISSGSATLTVSTLSTGSHSIGASFAGGNGFNPSATTAGTAVAVVDFGLTGPANGITVAAGASTGNTATVTLTPGAGGFPVGIVFACSGAPSAGNCYVSPVSVNPGSTSSTVTVTVTTTTRPALRSAASVGSLIPFFGISFLGVVSLTGRRRFKLMGGLLIWLIVMGASLTVVGCNTTKNSDSSPTPAPGTPAGASTLTITGTATSGAASLNHTVTISLNVT